ncbi:hypothetical protein G4V39_08525 [Thermosulfuriphilus ammonigenes]|uniref:Uncharacterized protein n=1 Tax=Thermosulfuriphilus ammonigenes TaxID=1936021 RepID=A0A6G7PXC7_9BACT|nr:hypothetical protein [Thermosulfuriphilus ammonigenes]MBA2849583.1 hypothetical protein [Thermosulfuriphilus ammonigenes]QIJ72312.1 hypothetical protein G4V39_08525 [Thermosulfuriphilus ammonigenes]
MGMWQKIIDSLGAAAFAEAGEFDQARQYLAEIGLLEGASESLSAWDKTMVAMAFAEAGEFDYAQEIIRDPSYPQVKVERELDLSQIHERLTEAITFAESGVPEHALEIIKQGSRPTVVVICQEGHYPQELWDCALKMAQAKGLDILVVSIFSATSASQGQLSREIRQRLLRRADDGLAPWVTQARSQGVCLGHMVSFTSLEATLRALKDEFRIRYVISLPEEEVPHFGEVHIFSF